MSRKLPIKFTFAYILLSVVYGLIDVNFIGEQLTHSIWWAIHGVIIMSIFLITSKEVFDRTLKISLRIIGFFVLLQSVISIIDIYNSINDKVYSTIVLLYFLSSLIYWKYDRRRS